ncbi:hypothetical protein P5V63_04275 [Mycobacteroides abscessus subsp. abscessus]|uniref:hypothetical protein n=1 Tax=Mycobacteroides abscessus TaxID=36809 RepID=UPI0009290936|nr:hypothetical protein [Mycobacteroides abscessus]MDO3092215.1 hypothetical protein [Mycobacteroides abscessus subsp. abscessus]PVB56067.1 hypothetical protein DDK10_14080 [Mycobacteroides abscessus]RIR69593.1 hypothetical protein D2E42_20050 [Mycobacteroides abscessus]SHX96803.1 proline and glycine rich transmembrane protein [Mycobacteroides abscessus subsp. abscessus]SIB45001.1 proline and glycine rich transmembrane protein [Mycobacteroides abscessus subsp. abscessus]
MTYPPQEPPTSGDPSAYDPNQPPPGYPNQPPPAYQPPPPGYQPGYQAGPPPGGPQYQGAQFPPPGYPPAGYGYPQQRPWPPQGPFSAGESWSWSWAQVSKRFGTFIPPYLVWFLAIGLPVGIVYAILMASLPQTSTSGYGGNSRSSYSYSYEGPELSGGAIAIMILLYAVVFAVSLYVGACLISANLDVADGKPVSFGTFFRARGFGLYVGAALLVGVGVLIGSLLIIGGVIFGFFAQYAVFFAIDRGLGPVDALKASFQLVKDNLGQALVVFLITLGVAFGGFALTFITCGLGGIIAYPAAGALTGLIHVYTYRRLTGGTIAPAPV